MGWLRKTIKKIGRGIKKVGKKIGKAFKKVLKPFAKIFNKLGPLGTIALSMFLPGIGTALAGWGAGMGNVLGTMIKFVGNAINYVATAPQKIFGTITDAIGASWNTLTGSTTGTWKPGSWFDNFSKQTQSRIAGDGWFGGKSGSWSSFDTTGGILPSGTNLTEGNIEWQGTQKAGGYSEVLPDGTIGKPLSKANLEFMNAQTIAQTPSVQTEFVSDGSVRHTGGDFEEGYYVDSVSGQKLKLDSSGKPIAIKKGTVISSDTLLGKGRAKLGEFRTKHDDKFWAASTGLNAYQAYNEFAGIGDDQVQSGSFDWQNLLGDTSSLNLFDTTKQPTWDYNYSTSVLTNQQASAQAWNSHYGFPQGFNPNATPGYGWTYQQWLQQAMGS